MGHFFLSVFARMLAAGALVTVVIASAAAEPPKPPPKAAKKPAAPEQVQQLVRQLGHKDYFVRKRAQDELARLGFEAFDALNAATTDPDLEIASRAKYLLRLMRVEWTAENDPPEVKTCLHNYEFQDARSRQVKMEALAALPEGQGVAALCRLVRFENTPVLSKAAAVAILDSQQAADPPAAAVVETVRKGLKNCTRPGAVWLLTWSRLGTDPDAFLSEWNKLTKTERELLRQTPNETSPTIVAGLTRFQIARLKKLGKTEEAMAAIGHLVEFERGNPESLAELLEWLVQQKAWKAVDDLSQRFAMRFAVEPGLLYWLAQAYAEQGKKDQAEQMAARAFRLHPGKQKEQLFRHLLAGQFVRRRGQIAWARREFEYVMAQAGAEEPRAMAHSMLAEMLHDQGQDEQAALVLEKLVAAIDAGKLPPTKLNHRKPSEFRARMNYFFACHAESKGDVAKRREYLDKALEADPADVDVLIACYRLPEQTPEHHAKIVKLIRKAATAIRQEITAEPEDPSPYNQIAWLIGNTEGDFDEALRRSQKSLELAAKLPELKVDLGGFHDTLARVYYAKGDLDNAVKQQTRAVELDPHSGLIRRQLEFFRKQREEKKKP